MLGGRRAHCGARDAQHLLPSLLRRYAKRGRSCLVDPLGMGGQVGNPNFGRSVLGRSVACSRPVSTPSFARDVFRRINQLNFQILSGRARVVEKEQKKWS